MMPHDTQHGTCGRAITVDTCGNLQFHIFLLERLILKDLQETSFILPHKFLLGRPSFSAVYECKKGVEIGLPICVLCHLAKSSQ